MIHHEIFHMIQNSYENNFNDKKFSLFNNSDFKYAECSTCSDRLNAMTSLLWTLKALEANVVAHLPLYLSEIAYDEKGRLSGETSELLKEALDLFI